MTDIRAGLHPDLLTKIDKVLAAMALRGHPMKIVQGFRTTGEQLKLYAEGRTLPGAIVTYADGVKIRSNHQAALDGPYKGYGCAVDCAFQGSEPFSEKHPWSLYGASVELAGLIWGGGHTHGWHGQDRPHAQLPKL
jgi:peptidoglycan L-alanyl-D-glutamate endopeptidase CwlK